MDRDYVIIADTTNDLPVSYAKENQVELIPLIYEIDGESYGKDKELTSYEQGIKCIEEQKFSDALSCFEAAIVTDGEKMKFVNCLRGF